MCVWSQWRPCNPLVHHEASTTYMLTPFLVSTAISGASDGPISASRAAATAEAAANKSGRFCGLDRGENDYLDYLQ